MIASDAAAFAHVPLNSKEESTCSPVVAESFRGIVIATPDSIDLSAPLHEEVGEIGAVPVLPVCGTASYSAATEARFQSFMNQLLLVAVDTHSHAPHVANLVHRGFEPAIADKPTPDQLEEWKNRYTTAWFNANAFYYLEDLPKAPARYHIFATIGDIVSNVRTVEVKGSGKGSATKSIAPGDALFGKAARAPAVPPEFRGVKVEARVPRWPATGGPVWIDGVIQLEARDAADLGVTPIQRAVVVTASSGFVFRSWSAAGERALFADDQETAAGVVRAAFSIEVSKAFAPSAHEGVYLLVSVGRFVASVVSLP